MSACKLTVNIYLCYIIARAEVEHHALVEVSLGQSDCFSVPYSAYEVCVADAGELAFRAKRNNDFFVKNR